MSEIATILNEVEVSGAEIVNILSQATGEEPNFSGIVGSAYPGELNRGFAVYFRVKALLDFLASDHSSWLIAGLPDGPLCVRPEVFEMSASEPLVEFESDWPSFDHNHFQQTLLGSARPDGRA